MSSAFSALPGSPRWKVNDKMAKRKSKTKKPKIKGAKPIPTGGSDDAQTFGYSQERFERSCQQIYDGLEALIAEPAVYDKFYDLAGKGFQEAQKRAEEERWPVFDEDSKIDIGTDLPQAACVLLMFHDVYQESGGWATYENTLVIDEMRVDYDETISELRERVCDYYNFQGTEKEADLFTACMIHLKQHVKQIGKSRGRPVKFTDEKCILALKLYPEEHKKCNDSKSAWEKVAVLLSFEGKGESLRKACVRYNKK
ncbi:hypothetical protein ES703_109522 [subsurface metagenome]